MSGGSQDSGPERIKALLAQADAHAQDGQIQDAQKLVRQALSIDPKDSQCGKAMQKLSKQENEPTRNLVQLLKDYLVDGDGNEDGRVAQTLANATPSPEDAKKMVSLLFELKHRRKEVDAVIQPVFTNLSCQQYAATILSKDVTATFNSFWEFGEGSMKALVLWVLLRPQAWSSEADRAESEKGVLLLLFAKLLEPGLDDEGVLIGYAAIARLLDQDAPQLQSYVSPDELGILLTGLDISTSVSRRSEATRAVVKLLEANDDKYQKLFRDFIMRKTATRLKSDLIIALSAAGRLFAVTRAVAVEILLTGDTLETLQEQVAQLDSPSLTTAYLELLSAACADGTCRQAIGESCTPWLTSVARSDNVDSSKAALVLTKTMGLALPNKAKLNVQSEMAVLTESFKGMLLGKTDDDKKQDAIEGLAYQSRNAKVKQDLASRTNILKAIMQHMMKVGATGPAVYGGLTIFSNMTTYPPPNAAEYAKMAKLKAYANQTTPELPDPLDDEDHVSTRCRKVLDAGIAPILVQATKKATPAILLLISSITLAISKHPKHRGAMVQQGLLDNALRLSITDLTATGIATLIHRQSALAVARCIIPIDPHLVFQKRSVEAALHPLKLLLQIPTTDDDDDVTVRWWRMFPVREALKALTNLATLQEQSADPSAKVQGLIMASFWELVEEHWTSDVLEVRRAATELVLNMATSALLLDKFIGPDNAAAPRRMQILTAYWGDDGDVGLRLAAGGALATLLEGAAYEGVRGLELFLATEHGVEYTVEALESLDEAFVARAVAVLQAVVLALKNNGVDGVRRKVSDKFAAVKVCPTLAELCKDGPMKEEMGELLHAMKEGGVGG